MQAGVNSRFSFWSTKALLGFFEGGFVPTSVVYLGYFYTSSELSIRLSYLFAIYRAASVIMTLIAYGVLRTSGLDNLPEWRWLFVLEGAFAFLIGFSSYLYLPPSPTQTASRPSSKVS